MNWETIEFTNEYRRSIKPLCYGQGKYVGTTTNWDIEMCFVVSTDGVNFESYFVENVKQLFWLEYGNGFYLFGGLDTDGNRIVGRSTNGYDWDIKVEDRITSQMRFINGQFLINGWEPNTLLVTKNGIDFEIKKCSFSDTPDTQMAEFLDNMTYGEGMYVTNYYEADSSYTSYTSHLYYSYDLETWGKIGTAPYALRALCFGGGKFIASGWSTKNANGVYESYICISEDGCVTWEKIVYDPSKSCSSKHLCYKNGVLVFYSENNSQDEIVTSFDFINFEKTPSIFSSGDYVIIANRTIIVGGSSSGYSGKQMMARIPSSGDSAAYVGIDGEYKPCEVYVAQDGEWKAAEVYVAQDGEYKLCGG